MTWTRWLPLSGFMYAVLYVVGLILIVGDEIDSKSDSEILSYYADGGNRSAHIIGFALIMIGLLLFVVFVSVLYERLRKLDKESSLLSRIAFASGVSSAGPFLTGAAALAATAITAVAIDAFTVDANIVCVEYGFGYLLLTGGVVASCGMVLSTSVLAFRTSVLPAWMGWVGLLAVVLAIGEVFLCRSSSSPRGVCSSVSCWPVGLPGSRTPRESHQR